MSRLKPSRFVWICHDSHDVSTKPQWNMSSKPNFANINQFKIPGFGGDILVFTGEILAR